jgi:hypothetical protein
MPARKTCIILKVARDGLRLEGPIATDCVPAEHNPQSDIALARRRALLRP